MENSRRSPSEREYRATAGLFAHHASRRDRAAAGALRGVVGEGSAHDSRGQPPPWSEALQTPPSTRRRLSARPVGEHHLSRNSPSHRKTPSSARCLNNLLAKNGLPCSVRARRPRASAVAVRSGLEQRRDILAREALKIDLLASLSSRFSTDELAGGWVLLLCR